MKHDKAALCFMGLLIFVFTLVVYKLAVINYTITIFSVVFIFVLVVCLALGAAAKRADERMEKFNKEGTKRKWN